MVNAASLQTAASEEKEKDGKDASLNEEADELDEGRARAAADKVDALPASMSAWPPHAQAWVASELREDATAERIVKIIVADKTDTLGIAGESIAFKARVVALVLGDGVFLKDVRTKLEELGIEAGDEAAVEYVLYTVVKEDA
jgi:hypothetical protein